MATKKVGNAWIDLYGLDADTIADLQHRAETAAVTEVAASATAVDLAAANTARRGLIVHNLSTSDTLYLKYGAGAAADSLTAVIAPGERFEMPRPVYTGQVTGVWATAAAGAAYVTELS